MTNSIWNIVLIVLVALSAMGVIAFISFVDMGLIGGTMGGMMSCGVGMAGAWLVGFLFIAVIAAAVIMLSHRIAQH